MITPTSGQDQAQTRIPGRPAARVAGDLNRLIGDTPRRLAEPLGPLPSLAPIPARVGVADWAVPSA